MSVASIILDNNLKKELEYFIPQELRGKLHPGDRVEIPLRGGVSRGFVIKVSDEKSFALLKPLIRLLSDESLPPDLFQLALFMSKYYCTSLSKVLKVILPSSVRKEVQLKRKIFLTSNKTKSDLIELCKEFRNTAPKQAEALEAFIHANKGIFLADLIKISNISRNSIDELIKKNILRAKKLEINEETLLIDEKYFQTQPKVLNAEQKEAFLKICDSIDGKKFKAHLIFGVTGSGKTEIYLQAIQKVLDLNKSAILLVPEIALTAQTIERVRSRFNQKIAILHHRKSSGEKNALWRALRSGDIKLVVGARSAVFAPVKDLGIIIVDEEHDASYKQSEEMPAYNAKNLAIMRGKICNCPIVLGSATPAIESIFNVENGKFELSKLMNRPFSSALPMIKIIDMKKEREKVHGFTHFSDLLLDGIKKRYSQGEQTLLFLNRRGFHSFALCTACNTAIKCVNCSLSLTYHKGENSLTCHLCGYNISPPKSCPYCGEDAKFQYKGYGTEHVERSLKAIFPEIRSLRIDRDTTKGKYSHELFFKEFKAGKADVLIGTQMIAKGLHFPAVTLVGVLNADASLNIPDFRASEHLFQLLVQVSGRAGRSGIKGEVIIQTYNPENPLIGLAAEQDFFKFYQAEIEERKALTFPPFSQLSKIVFSGREPKVTKDFASEFRLILTKVLPASYSIFPVVSSAKEKVKNKFYFQLLIRGKTLPLSDKFDEILATICPPKGVQLFIDIDPLSTF